ncbi:MAG: tRNA lysidine(34) synthetase TilS [bacterium]
MRKEEIEKEILTAVKKTIEAHNMLKSVKTAIIGFSTGPDSVCMLDTLKTLCGAKIKIYLVYVNHQLRQENILKKEEALTRFYARKYKCAYKIIKVKVLRTGKGIEAEARKKRYDALTDFAKKVSAQRIFLGHNLDDLVETFFMNLIRGSGSLGLQAMPAVRLPFVRPLINIRKSEILDYLKKRGLKFSRDISNLNLNIRRNYIRKRVIPLLLNLNPQLYEVVKREIDILHNDAEFMDNFVEEAFRRTVKKSAHGFTIDLSRILYYNKAIINRVILKILKLLKGDLTGLSSKHIEEIISLKDKQSGRRIILPQNLYAQRIFGKIFISNKFEAEVPDFYMPLKIGEPVEVGNFRLKLGFIKRYDRCRRSANCEVFDYDRIVPPLFLRNRRPGDVIKIKNGRKKLKEILIEAKIPVNERNGVILLCDQHSILWAVGVRRADQAYVDEETKNILRVEFEYLN